jgi:hypothetical protein
VIAVYPATYADAHGAIAAAIENDGHTLRVVLDGVLFTGTDLDGLEPAAPAPRFTLASGSLCACTLALEMPVGVLTPAGEVAARLGVSLRLGRPDARGGIDEEVVVLTLDGRLTSRGASGWFEDELADLARQLPAGHHLRICWGCALSDYSPAGHGLFGGMACFRDRKDAYRAARGKIDLFALLDPTTLGVQETWVCPEFEVRAPGTGYRG